MAEDPTTDNVYALACALMSGDAGKTVGEDVRLSMCYHARARQDPDGEMERTPGYWWATAHVKPVGRKNRYVGAGGATTDEALANLLARLREIPLVSWS